MAGPILGAALSGTTRTALGGSVKSAFGSGPTVTGGGEAFADSLSKLIDGVENTQANANVAITDMVENDGEVHDAMIAMQRAEMSLQLTVQVRNKLVSAYQEIMRMPI
jgi:flagellar hook-basal body complex protein FliE